MPWEEAGLSEGRRYKGKEPLVTVLVQIVVIISGDSQECSDVLSPPYCTPRLVNITVRTPLVVPLEV